MVKAKRYREQFVLLFSAVRREANRGALYAFTTEFLTNDERQAWSWLRSYVQNYSEFPKPSTVRAELGMQTIKAKEPWGYYADRLRRMHIYERGAENYRNFVDAFKGADVDKAAEEARAFLSLYQRSSQAETGLLDFGGALDSVVNDYALAQMNPGLRGIQTGWPLVDQMTGGWQNGDIITFAARPGVGKTYSLLHSAHTAWTAGHKVLFVSNEMAALQISRRFVGIHTRINPDLIRRGQLSSHVRGMFLDGIEHIRENAGNMRLLIGGMRKSVTAVRAACEESLPDLIVIDASYLLKPEKKRSGAEGRREAFSDVVEELRALSLDLNRPIVQSVQFNRQAVRSDARRGGNVNSDDGDSDNRRNPLAHLGLHKVAETDVVGQASSIVIGMEKCEPPYQHTRRHMGFLKGREGEVGNWIINYSFNPVDFSVVVSDEQEATEGNLDLNFMV